MFVFENNFAGRPAALAALRCRRGLPAAGLHVLAPDARRCGRDACQALGLAVVWSWAARRAHHDVCCLWLQDGETALCVCSFTAWSLVEKTKTPAATPSGGQQEEQVCLQVTQGSRGPARRRRGEESGPAVSGRCGPVTGCSLPSLRVGVGEAVLTVHCGTACFLGEWLVEEGCVYLLVYKIQQQKLSRGVLGWGKRLI